MRAVLIITALVLTGCVSTSDLVKALATDHASACVVVKATLYGHVVAGRANTGGAARVVVTPDGCSIEHQGGAQ